jgi:hypothetical protein
MAGFACTLSLSLATELEVPTHRFRNRDNLRQPTYFHLGGLDLARHPLRRTYEAE